MKLYFSFLLVFLLNFTLSAQNNGILKGKIIDKQENKPLGYATIRVLKKADNQLVAGNITNDGGQFSIEMPLGEYYAIVEFIGYKAVKTDVFLLSKDNSIKDLGTILLETAVNTLDEVVVQGEKSSMELALDKRTFNVGKDLGNAGGSATEILNNIPSVSVDVDGTVKLRGSENVRILIDGKPSGLVSFKGSSGLQQLQANMIEKVEVITNPSARYEAEGMAGIINIILKKEQKNGLNGSFEVILGNPVNYGLGLNLNYRHKKVNFFVNYGLSYRKTPGKGEQYQEVFGKDTTFISDMNRYTVVTGLHNNIRGGLDFFFNEKSVLTAFYLLRRTDVNRITDLNYTDYLNKTSNKIGNTMRQQDEVESEPNSEYALTYKRSFHKKGQELTADFRILDYWERSDQTYTQNAFFANNNVNSKDTKNQKSLNDEFETQYLLQVDYTHPIAKDGKFETGVRTSLRNMINDYLVIEKGVNGVFFALPNLDNVFVYDENIIASYAIYGNKKEKISYQFGVRGEYTDIKTTLKETNQSNPRSYFNFFPSTHFTYKLPKDNSLQLSYSRRIRRPTYGELTSFVTFSDNRNFFSGNPNLNPEYTNAFELGHIKYFGLGSLTSSIYYRYTQDKIQNIRQVKADGFGINQPENLIDENAFGLEFTTQITPKKWYKGDFNFNFFRAITDGSNIDTDYQSDTYSWFMRHTSRFMLPKDMDLQMRLNYEAPQKTPQGERLAIAYMDLGMNKDILKGKGTLTLNVSDVLNSRVFRAITKGDNFYTKGNFQGRLRQINLTFNYRLNKNTKKIKSLLEE